MRCRAQAASSNARTITDIQRRQAVRCSDVDVAHFTMVQPFLEAIVQRALPIRSIHQESGGHYDTSPIVRWGISYIPKQTSRPKRRDPFGAGRHWFGEVALCLNGVIRWSEHPSMLHALSFLLTRSVISIAGSVLSTYTLCHFDRREKSFIGEQRFLVACRLLEMTRGKNRSY